MTYFLKNIPFGLHVLIQTNLKGLHVSGVSCSIILASPFFILSQLYIISMVDLSIDSPLIPLTVTTGFKSVVSFDEITAF
jgi:hypothetical protein